MNLAAGEVIETWKVGIEQLPDNDLKKFAEEGYSKDSLVYACIREKASSFAALKPQIVRANNSIVTSHDMLTLLNNPNTYQDGASFADELMTHLQASGNAYIHKVRVSLNRARRQEFRGYPVQELSLIRPDYVTIEPGATRDADIFLVTVGGQVRARIPRSDMIHLTDVNIINDFYGLSRIAVLVREISADLEMSDFMLSFYRNAGVPLGILNLKGRVKRDEAEQAKKKIDKAISGFKRWWTTLVLNADEASYTQLATAPANMEQDNTRAHVESRICSVFGVPGILVGARFALNATASFDYEQNQFQFWSETMVPEARRIAAAFTKQLMPEFAVTRDRGAMLSYDFTEVRALQEDRSQKLREVVRLVLTGGFTVNQALTLTGMNPIAEGDFYVRNGNHVIARIGEGGEEELTPMTEAATSTPNPDNPLEGAALSTRRALAELDDEDVTEDLFKELSIFMNQHKP